MGIENLQPDAAEDTRSRFKSIEQLPLSDEEIKKLRTIIEQDARAKWFWSSLRTWILAISSTIALLTVGLDGLKSIVKRLVS